MRNAGSAKRDCARARALRAGAGRCLQAATRTHRRRRLSRAGCSRAGASSSATSSRARSLAPRWRELLSRCAGWRRGARFAAAVSSHGFVGEQFALPEAIDALRAVRRTGETAQVRVGAYDPLSLAGIIVPAEEPDGAIPTVSEAG